MNREVMTSLAWGIGIVVLALCATFARSRGYIDSEMVDRIVMGAIGLMVAWFGNQMPKRFVPSARARQAQRDRRNPGSTAPGSSRAAALERSKGKYAG